MIQKIKTLLPLLLLVACHSSVPSDTNEPLAPSSPEAQGIPSSATLSFIEAAETQLPDALHSLMILRHVRTVAAGRWAPYRAETPHSITYDFTFDNNTVAVDGAYGMPFGQPAELSFNGYLE